MRCTLLNNYFSFLLFLAFTFAFVPMATSQSLYKTFNGFATDKETFTTEKEIFTLLQNSPSASEAYRKSLAYKAKSKKLGYFSLASISLGGLLIYQGTRDIDPEPGPVMGGLLLGLAGAILGTTGILYSISSVQEKSKVIKYYNEDLIGNISSSNKNIAFKIKGDGAVIVLTF